ncbi:JM94 [macacine gammaherpesvirus 11]|uniref:JM94 n=2 Tax=macacine gammaherpesvirus 11 TaxID=2560570 RepID=G9JMS2_9GAMA|nr:JM94 [Macaca fuscata rhadinovirus]AAT00071.1 JM94 [Macaca fuscata rhadinovirus]AEW87619.1 JM94 [Macaca fuscata rhadinovirus]AEW87789.1 JM94 [Macaca fuscata rhadinovirus]
MSQVRPLPDERVNEIRAIFSTSGDMAEVITDILTGTQATASFFCVLHDRGNVPINTPHAVIKLCLPARRPGGGPRCLPLMVLNLPAWQVHLFLTGDAPLTSDNIKDRIDLAQTEEILEPILSVLACKRSAQQTKHDSFKSKVAWFRAKFVSALRKVYKMTPSPYWMITLLGSFEASFVLAGTFYFFQSYTCTAETLVHLTRLFISSQGQSLVTVNTYDELGRVFGRSDFLEIVPNFWAYLKYKMQQDDVESKAIDQTINSIRGGLMLSPQDLVHFIYLSFYECMNAQTFLSYSRTTASLPTPATVNPPQLCRRLEADFKEHVMAYYNKASYLSTYITILTVPAPLPEGYENFQELACQYWCGQSRDVAEIMTRINDQYPQLNLTKDLSGLLDLAALDQDSGGPKENLFTVASRIPTYRCEFLNKQYFVLMHTDCIDAYWKQNIIVPEDAQLQGLTDQDLTSRIFYCDLGLSLPTFKQQIMVSRHEYFNPRLPVYRWVLDFDLKVTEGRRTLNDIYNICVTLRQVILETLQLIGPLKPHHPVYFFKSACPAVTWPDDISDTAFCHCDTKIGMRIVTPFPIGYCLVGSAPLVSLTNILNRVVKLDTRLASEYPGILEDKGPFDSGIYAKGRCVRVPHCYKVGPGGELSRLLKIIICHPEESDKSAYLKNAFKVSNLLHHAPGDSVTKNGHLVYAIADENEGFLESKTKNNLPKTITDLAEKIERTTEKPLIDWAATAVWPKLHDTIQRFFPDDRIGQFASVSFMHSGDNIIQVRPQKGNNFFCINHKHRNHTQTVRVFLTLHSTKESEVTVTFMSQCFAAKCNHNSPTAHFSFMVPITCT